MDVLDLRAGCILDSQANPVIIHLIWTGRFPTLLKIVDQDAQDKSMFINIFEEGNSIHPTKFKCFSRIVFVEEFFKLNFTFENAFIELFGLSFGFESLLIDCLSCLQYFFRILISEVFLMPYLAHDLFLIRRNSGNQF